MITLKAQADCKHCHGSGKVYDHVPYGMGTTAMPSDCDCATDNCTDEEFRRIEAGEQYTIEPAEGK